MILYSRGLETGNPLREVRLDVGTKLSGLQVAASF